MNKNGASALVAILTMLRIRLSSVRIKSRIQGQNLLTNVHISTSVNYLKFKSLF